MQKLIQLILAIDLNTGGKHTTAGSVSIAAQAQEQHSMIDLISFCTKH